MYRYLKCKKSYNLLYCALYSELYIILSITTATLMYPLSSFVLSPLPRPLITKACVDVDKAART